jgi:hypothetical protein
LEDGLPEVTDFLLRSLRDYLPDKLARKRWQAAVKRLLHFRSEVGTDESRQFSDIFSAGPKHFESREAPMVISPLPALLKEIHGELSGVGEKEDALLLAPYVRILDDLTASYKTAKSIDEDFLLLFQQIAVELEKICEFMGGTEEIDAAASVHGPVSLTKLLIRVSRFKGLPESDNDRRTSSPEI